MRARPLAAFLVVGLLLLVVPAVAAAHQDEPAKALVQAAIALLRNQPDQLNDVKDTIGEALASKDATGVDLDLVRKAQAAIESGDLATAETELELSIGAAPGYVVETPNAAPGQPAQPASELLPHPVGHERTLGGGFTAPKGAGAAAVLGVAAALALGGLLVVRRVR